MRDPDFDRLRPIGLSLSMARELARVREELTGAPLRVTEVHRETIGVHDGQGALTARVLPRLARSLAEEGAGLAGGDWVLGEADRHGECWIHVRAAPQSQLARRDIHRLAQPVAAGALPGAGAGQRRRTRGRIDQGRSVRGRCAATRRDVARAAAHRVEHVRHQCPGRCVGHRVGAMAGCRADAGHARLQRCGQVDSDQYLARGCGPGHLGG